MRRRGLAAISVVALALACRLHWRQAVAALAASSLLIPVALLLLQPGLATYRGLSGLDSALFVLVAAALLAAPRAPRPPRTDDVPPALAARLHALLPRLAAGAALVGFAAKLAWEATTGAAVFVDSQAAAFVPVPLAHLVGGLCGVAALRFLP